VKIIKTLTALSFVAVVAFSCQNDDSIKNIEKENSEEPVDNTDTTDDTDTESTETPEPTSLTSSLDRLFFEQLRGFGDIYSEKEFIRDYYFLDYPMYFIFKNASGGVEKGFIINPISTIETAVKLGKNENFGLNIYRYDKLIDNGLKELNDGNGLYAFDFEIDGEDNYYLQVYEEAGIKGLNGLNDITTAAHEAFHDHYQTTDATTNSDWEWDWDLKQDKDNFPITKELLELQILNTEILKELPNIKDISIIREKMKQYISIKSKEMEIDPSSDKLILNMELRQERLEGSPHYVEILARREFSKQNANDPNYEDFGITTLDNKESFFTPGKKHLPFTYDIKSKPELQNVLGFDVAYPMGASVIYCINELDKSKWQQIKTKTPYEIISSMLNLNTTEKEQAIEKAKASVDWKKIQNRATELLNLR